jgi:cystathionine beta-synthase
LGVEYVNSLIELVGHTPLLKLSRVTDGAKPLILAKVEYLNPGGSVKDRIALKMIEGAEHEGKIKPGGTIVEPTSGNTGVGLAIVAQAKGYSCVFVCPDKVSEDKRNVLSAYGARVVVCPTAVEPEHPDSYYSVTSRAPGSLINTAIRTTQLAITRQPVPSSGSKPTARSRTLLPASAPEGRSVEQAAI